MREHFKVTAPGASPDELAELQARLGHALPDAYMALLSETNGAEWCVHDVGGDCLKFWMTQDVPVLNEEYQIQRWLPGVVAIGSDGGSAIILDSMVGDEPNLWPVFVVDFGALDPDEFIPVAPNFLHWSQNEFRFPRRD